MKIAALIPAFKPSPGLPDLVRRLAGSGLETVIVVDDGSGPGDAAVFEEIEKVPKARVLRHEVNRGKGAALKTGLGLVASAFPDLAGAVTADADGQHLLEDILKVARALEERPDRLILGTRAFGRGVPFRSWLGNTLTRGLFRILVGAKVSDTQTGLRGIPRAMIPRLLQVTSNRYEFELEMLLLAKHGGIPVQEESIRTVYQEGNPTSHFRRVFDSARIYRILFRLALGTAAAAAVDCAAFLALRAAGWSLLADHAAARLAAILLGYLAVRRMAFYCGRSRSSAFIGFAALLMASGVASWGFQGLLHSVGFRSAPAKVLSEALLYTASFAVLRDFLFTARSSGLIPRSSCRRDPGG